MSHVDEGRLHAFLDGALSAADPADAERVELHLVACADCRARLDEATRLRDEASALLGTAQPRVATMPSFEAIRARADAIAAGEGSAERKDASFGAWGKRSSGRRRAFLATPFNGAAWAATVVLAVGLGWLLRDNAGDGERSPITDMSGGAVADRGRAFDVQAESLEERLSAPTAETSAPAAPVTSNARQQEAGYQRPSPPPSSPAELVQTEELRVAGVQAGAATGERAAADYDVVEEDAAGREDGRDLAAQAAPEPARRMESARASAPPPPPPAAAAPAMTDAMGAGAGEETGWRDVALTEAQRITGGQVLLLARARVERVSLRAGAAEVRTVQITDRGETIEVLQRRAADETLSREASPGAGAANVAKPVATVRVDDWAVTISGASQARLDELARSLD